MVFANDCGFIYDNSNITNDYKQKMQELVGDELIASKRQEMLIEEVKNKRLVCLFENERSLQLQSNTELITLKSRLLWQS